MELRFSIDPIDASLSEQKNSCLLVALLLSLNGESLVSPGYEHIHRSVKRVFGLEKPAYVTL